MTDYWVFDDPHYDSSLKYDWNEPPYYHCSFDSKQCIKNIMHNTFGPIYCSDSVKDDGNVFYYSYACTEFDANPLFSKYSTLASTLVSEITSSRDAAMNIVSNNRNIIMVDWDWGYKNLERALSSGSFVTPSPECIALKAKITDECNAINYKYGQELVNCPMPEIAESMRSVFNLIGFLYEATDGVYDMLILTHVYDRLMNLDGSLGHVASLSRALRLDMQLSESKLSVEQAVKDLSGILEERSRVK